MCPPRRRRDRQPADRPANRREEPKWTPLSHPSVTLQSRTNAHGQTDGTQARAVPVVAMVTEWRCWAMPDRRRGNSRRLLRGGGWDG